MKIVNSLQDSKWCGTKFKINKGWIKEAERQGLHSTLMTRLTSPHGDISPIEALY